MLGSWVVGLFEIDPLPEVESPNWQLTRSRRSSPPLHQTAFDSARLELYACSDVNLLLRQPLVRVTGVREWVGVRRTRRRVQQSF